MIRSYMIIDLRHMSHSNTVIDLNSVTHFWTKPTFPYIHSFDIIDFHSLIHSKPIIYSYYVDSLM